ncbi:hypothetical protein F5Y19DRAFT_475141 [Xylariaceae sp. FL1651]|nr:hypothetical protein F5Y19DRAFT_475141 [Xylariaceae sp. FL1651]
MRPSSFLATLGIAVYALPLPAVRDPLLDNLPDTILDSISDLLGYPLSSHDDEPSFLPCDFDTNFCVGDCAAECIGGAQACSNCLSSCYKDTSCQEEDDDKKKKKKTKSSKGSSSRTQQNEDVPLASVTP